ILAPLGLFVKLDKYTLGYKSAFKQMAASEKKLVLIAGDCSPLRKSELECYAMVSKTTDHHFSGTNIALRTAAGKLSMLGIVKTVSDQGDCDLLNLAKGNAA
ncbi:hypothetical protein B0H19DRAFT_945018, partial [Mycena capillaripes]